MSTLRNILLAALALALVAMAWQHLRYADVRRSAAQDRQAALHGSVHHVLTHLEAASGTDPVPALRALASAAHEGRHGELIYAGQAVVDGLVSPQLTEAMGREVGWSAVLLQQFEDPEAYAAYLADPEVAAALEAFPTRVAHGFERSVGLNLLLPQLFLARKLWRALTLRTASLPLEPAAGAGELEGVGASLVDLPAGRGEDAIVIVNLMRDGTEAQQAANASYAGRMMDLMSDFGYGPIHLGAYAPLDHPLRYDSVALVYYPGAAYFRDLVGSRYFQGIIGDKQLADTQSTITLPITDLVAPLD